MEKEARRKRIALVLSATEAEAYGDHHSTGSWGQPEADGDQRRRCYLCQRVDGERGVALQNDSASSVLFTTVRLSRYQVELLEWFAFEYLLCFECAALIHAFEVSAVPDLSLDPTS